MNGRMGIVALALSIVVALLAPAAVSSAAGPFEPNENIPAAAGPLVLGATYGGAIEAPSDLDFFYFYVTGAAGSTVSLSAANQGGGESGAELDARVIDNAGTPLGNGISYLRAGESRAETLTLPPGKYFLEVTAKEGFGDSYLLSPGGGTGAFGTYAQIAGHCAAATKRAAALQIGVTRVEGRLQRARSKFRRSRYGGRDARRVAHARLVRVEKQVVAKKTALRRAVEAQSPWCEIPQ